MAIKWFTLVAAVAIAGADAYIAYRAPVWADSLMNEALAISVSCIPFPVLATVALLAGYMMMRSEWQHHTSLRLLSYPVSGAGVVSAKVAAATAAIILLAAVAGVGSLAVASRSPGTMTLLHPPDSPLYHMKPWEIAVSAATALLTALSWLAMTIAAGAFSFAVGTLVPRIACLIAFAVYGLLAYLAALYSPLAMYVASFMPNPPVVLYARNAIGIERVVAPMIPLWPMVAAAAALILVTGKLLDREVDA